ncbi:MAG: ribosome biogenesis GTPase Der [Alphaproteobacteria bacterium]|nr:ribosome biogenesis GTPase Der [Alphaproteobacteria bacterium]
MLRIAIIGRPNVGKSTLFNKLAGKHLAIVDDTPGVTRDWREAEGDLYGQPLIVIDTAGLEEAFDESIQGRMRQQTEAALARADIILFVIDGREGVTPQDTHFAAFLRKQKKPIIMVVNKCENSKRTQSNIAESYALGFGDPVAISAAHSVGLDDLYHALEPHFKDDEDAGFTSDNNERDNLEDIDALEGLDNFEFEQEDIDPENPIKLAIIGRPNVGKSTLLNAILKEQRVMTGPEAGITRDAIAVDWEFEGRKFKLVDTAGLRKKSKIDNQIEKMSAEDSFRAIRLAQIVVLVLDGNIAFEKQDLQLAQHVIDEGRVLILAVNKWDIVKDRDEMREKIRYRLDTGLGQIRDIPFVTISAKNGKNIERLFQQALEKYEVWNARVSTGKMNRWLAGMESQNPAPLVSGRQNRLKYITQIKTRPPTFALWVSYPKDLPQSYRRYIINGLRQDFDIPSVPIRLLVRTSKNPYS